MTKELEAFNRVSESLLHAVGGIGNAHYIDYSNSVEPAKEDLDIIEAAIKRLDSIEITAIDIEQDNKALYKENKKLIQALEIIKKKAVNVYIFLLSATLEDYNKTISNFDWRQLTQEEYDFLKEVLKGE